MKHTDSRTEATRDKANRANRDLLQKGILVAFIGLSVLFAPHFMRPSELRDVVANSYLVGWFGLILGAALAGQAVLRIRAQRRSIGR